MPSEVPHLYDYDVWVDADGFHARPKEDVSNAADSYHCLQQIDAGTALELIQEAVRNRVRIWRWQAARGMRWSEVQDPR